MPQQPGRLRSLHGGPCACDHARPMSAPNETDASETAQPTPQPGSATGETVLLSVEEAAGVLGISPQAVRKRIGKGQLNARRDGRAWLVMLERATIETGETETAATGTKPSATTGAQPRNLVAAQQAEQMTALVASIQAPLLDRIEAANREAERERVARHTAEHERDELITEVELLRSIPRPADVPANDPGQDQRTTSPAAPGATEAPESTPNTLHEPSVVTAWVRRLFGWP